MVSEHLVLDVFTFNFFFLIVRSSEKYPMEYICIFFSIYQEQLQYLRSPFVNLCYFIFILFLDVCLIECIIVNAE